MVKMGLMAEQPYKEQWLEDLARLLKGYTQADLNRMGEWVVEHEMWPQRRQDVIDELKGYTAMGHRVIIASATYSPVLGAFARRLEISEWLGTPFQMSDGRATGRFEGVMNTGQRKLECLLDYTGRPPDLAFGDTPADIPLLAASQQPVATYPDTALLAHAREKGWRIIGG
jgi:phosphoserine phosphatase